MRRVSDAEVLSDLSPHVIELTRLSNYLVVRLLLLR
jgi:hypothetical protein